ncbi:hypothetical protein [Desulfonema magnum]|uniref:Uncharacterized protein n=1 Tax=Desulfonema magnum TaxID=45655 RepID=A0A975BIJ3_9BACT|nr:hypothetical protein [Desulfonema magnum]QTA85998.1 Uncharacterized protein dnm_020160 [Desulfonema magnum]
MNQGTSSINQNIFKIGLSVETISVYLLCCGLSDSGTSISTKNLLEIWNSTNEALMKSLEDLEQKNILFMTLSDQEGKNIYQLTDSKEWKV